MAYQEQSYLGGGKVYLEEEGGTTGLLFAGLVDELKIGIETESKELADLTSGGGGTYNKLDRIKSMTLNMKAREFSARNIAMALYGAATAVTAGTVTDEVHTARLGALVKFANMPDLSAACAVTDNAGTTTYVENTDYTRNGAGIEILDTGSIVAGSTIKVDYTKKAGSVVQALVNSGKVFRLVFAGLNEAQSGKPFNGEIFRVKFSPTSDLSLIGDDFGELPLAGAALADVSKSGVGISRYGKFDV